MFQKLRKLLQRRRNPLKREQVKFCKDCFLLVDCMGKTYIDSECTQNGPYAVSSRYLYGYGQER